MTLGDIMQAVENFSYEELRDLREYIEQRERQVHPARGATPQERIQRMRNAAAAIREGMTQEELDEMFAAMNEEYIEPVDDDIWKD